MFGEKIENYNSNKVKRQGEGFAKPDKVEYFEPPEKNELYEEKTTQQKLNQIQAIHEIVAHEH